FDRWSADAASDYELNFGELDLVQKRNHILTAALAALPITSRELLSTVALLPGSFDYDMLCAVNAMAATEQELRRTVAHLESRGLLQYDRQARHYDLHPVVRGVAKAQLSSLDTDRF